MNSPFLEQIRVCNRHDLSAYLPFLVDGVAAGWVRPSFARVLASGEGPVQLSSGGVEVTTGGGDLEQRSAPLAELLERLVQRGSLSHLHGERYPVTVSGRHRPLLLIDRAAAPYFGIRAFGQHVTGFVRGADGLQMWIGRRAKNKRRFPGMLDHLVAGGLPYGIGLRENLHKECREEAGMDASLASRAVPVGTVTYVCGTRQGLKPDVLYCYDLELPGDFRPRCTDGEVEEFFLWPMERVIDAVAEPGVVKPNCSLVIIDFLIRHGYLGPEDEDYVELVSALHPPLP